MVDQQFFQRAIVNQKCFKIVVFDKRLVCTVSIVDKSWVINQWGARYFVKVDIGKKVEKLLVAIRRLF
ncbi:hypothetical protein D3C86_1858490 [compost metagenome]